MKARLVTLKVWRWRETRITISILDDLRSQRTDSVYSTRVGRWAEEPSPTGQDRQRGWQLRTGKMCSCKISAHLAELEGIVKPSSLAPYSRWEWFNRTKPLQNPHKSSFLSCGCRFVDFAGWGQSQRLGHSRPVYYRPQFHISNFWNFPAAYKLMFYFPRDLLSFQTPKGKWNCCILGYGFAFLVAKGYCFLRKEATASWKWFLMIYTRRIFMRGKKRSFLLVFLFNFFLIFIS